MVLDDGGVPFCAKEDCPQYDGKRCRILGLRPDVICEPAIRELIAFWSDTEARSADAHAVYQKEAHRRGDVRHPDAYADLSDATKEWDRVLVRWVAETIRMNGATP
jgi:hypothetical protein